MKADVFEEFQAALKSEGAESALATLASQLRAEERYGELFDVRLMQARLKHGLPVGQSAALETLPEPQRREVENDYLAACREVGFALLANGRVREAWKYLRPTGEQAAVAAELSKHSPGEENSEENVDELVEVALHEGVAPELGFQWLLAHYGLCNAISAMESVVSQFGLPVRQAAAAMLVRELHRELLASVQEDVAAREPAAACSPTLRELLGESLQERVWLLAEGRHHLDTSHLAAVVRSARLVEDREVLRLALDLTEYGRRLHADHQYADDEPFANLYPSHGLFFAAQLGENVDAAIEHFRHSAESNPSEAENTMPAETYVVLLARLGRTAEAIAAAIEFLPPVRQPFRFAPSLVELCRAAGDFTPLVERCRRENDPVGFAAAVVEEARGERSG